VVVVIVIVIVMTMLSMTMEDMKYAANESRISSKVSDCQLDLWYGVLVGRRTCVGLKVSNHLVLT
jgi:hypothetical protein